MIVDAVVTVRNVNKNVKRLDVYSPKFQQGRPIFGLTADYEGRPVKLVTGWSDIPLSEPVRINGTESQYGDELTNKVTLTRGMTIECANDENVYVCVPEVMIK
jgi:hypothetical protein